MSAEPKVSVIIPVYNAGKYIDESLKSVLGQSYQNIEIIAVNDGSSDNSKEILLSYGDKIKYIEQLNRGASAARNAGIRAAEGAYIAFQDSDDVWHPEKLSLQMDQCQKLGSVTLCYTGHAGSDSPLLSRQNIEPTVTIIDSFPLIFNKPYLGTSGVLLKRSLLESVGVFDESLATSEDVDLWLRVCFENPRVIKIEEPLFFRLSSSLGTQINSYDDNLKVVDRFCKRHPEFLLQNTQLVKDVQSHITKKKAEHLIWQGDFYEGRKTLFQALAIKADRNGIGLIIKSFFQQLKSILLGDK